MTNTLKSGFRVLTVLAIFATSIQVAPTASAVSIGPLYNGTSGDVACTTNGQQTGFFTIVDNVVTGSSGCEGTVAIPQGVTTIGYRAFRTNYQITALSFPNSVVTIGEGAFDSVLFNLQTLVLPSNLQTIGNGAFIQAVSITTLVIPNSVTAIGDFAFYSLRAVTSLTLPTSLTSIGQYGFANASVLTSLTIPNGVTSIGEHAFREAGQLSTLNLPSTLTSIGGYTFASSSSLLSYNYCGTSLNDDSLEYAGLSGKTKTCTVSVSSSNSDSASSAAAAAAAAIVQREAEIRTARAEIVEVFKSSKTATAESFAQAEIRGITKSNIDDVNAEIALLPVDSRTSLNEIVKIARKYEVIGVLASDLIERATPNLLVEIGLVPAENKNKTEILRAVRGLSAENRSSYASIKSAIAQEMIRIQMRKDRLAAILARISGGSGK
jgi:hypothetical protein